MMAEGEAPEQVMIDAIHLEVHCIAARVLNKGIFTGILAGAKAGRTVSYTWYVITQATRW